VFETPDAAAAAGLGGSEAGDFVAELVEGRGRLEWFVAAEALQVGGEGEGIVEVLVDTARNVGAGVALKELVETVAERRAGAWQESANAVQALVEQRGGEEIDLALRELLDLGQIGGGQLVLASNGDRVIEEALPERLVGVESRGQRLDLG
jgi:hypothetical protein